MSQWHFATQILPGDDPLFVRLSRSVIDDIRRGRIKPGQRLPGSRTLARSLKVHRNTVLAAIDDLVAQGWLVTKQASGTFVASTLPEGSARSPLVHQSKFGAHLHPSPTLQSLGRVFEPGAMKRLLFSAGTPDPRQVPVEALSRAWRRAVKGHGHRLLEYGHPAGHLGLRRALAEMVSSVRAVPASEDTVLVTRGSQGALDLCARALIQKGDVVAVEALGYHPGWAALRLAGAKLVAVPVDKEGLQVDALRKFQNLRAVYVTPHHQYPTTVTMSASRRMQLLALARQRRFVILEDDYDHEFHFDGQPVMPLASQDTSGLVVYIGTLSKVLAPGLRLGFVVAPQPLMNRMVLLRSVTDRQGDHPMEAAVADLLESGELGRHVRKTKRATHERRDLLVDLLRRHLGQALQFEVPLGGLALWARWVAKGDFEKWLARCEQRGVTVYPGRRYAFSGDDVPAVRLVFSRFTPAELTKCVIAMKAGLVER